MKKQTQLLFIIINLFIFLALAACSSDNEEKKPKSTYLKLSTELIEVSSSSQSVSFDIETDGKWEILSVDQDWYSLSSTQGNSDATITIEIKENKEEKSQEDDLIIKAGDISKKLTIKQFEKTDLALNKSSITFLSEGGTEQFTIQCNRAWEIIDVPEWLSLEKTSGEGDAVIKIVAEKNYEDDAKNAILKIVAGGVTQELQVSQKATYGWLKLNSSNYELFTKDLSEAIIDFETNRKWKLEDVPAWVVVDKTEGVDNASIVMTVEANGGTSERDATIRLVAGNRVQEIYINQWTATEGTIKGFNDVGDGNLTKAIHRATYNNTKDAYIKTLNVVGELSLTDLSALKEVKNVTKIDMTQAKLTAGWFGAKLEKHETLETILLPTYNGTLGSRTFENCTALKSITIPEGYTGNETRAFSGCTSLESVTLPSTYTTFGEYTFENCTALKEINIPQGTKNITFGQFINCTNLKRIKLPSSLKEIGQIAFQKSGLTSIALNEGLEIVGPFAFSGVSLSSPVSITIPKSVTVIERGAFKISQDLVMHKVVIEGNPILGDGAFNSANIKELHLKSKTPLKHSGVGIDAPFTGHMSATLYIPTGSRAAYAADEFWSKFGTIIEE